MLKKTDDKEPCRVASRT